MENTRYTLPELATSDQPEFRLTTERFAAANGIKPTSVRHRFCTTGSYFGIRPLKLASGRLLWPDVNRKGRNMRKCRKKYDLNATKSPELRDRNTLMIRDRIFGATITQLARNYGMSRCRAHQIVEGVAVMVTRPPRKQSYYRPRPERAIRFFEKRQQAYRLRALGYSHREIAAQIGVSDSFVHLHTRRVVIRELHGRAWLSHELGRPKDWKRSLIQPKEKHHG